MFKMAAVILAGGRGSRMDGEDKGLVKYQGREMVKWSLDVVRPLADSLIISCNRNIGVYSTLADAVVCDRLSGYLGPLAGVHAALEVTDSHSLLVLPCDTPLLGTVLLERLISQSEQTPQSIVYFSSDQQMHPLHAVIPVNLKESLCDYLIDGGRSVMRWYAQHPNIVLSLNEDESKQLANINYTSELD